MPLICMTKAIGIKIGESLGILEAVDTEGDGVEWGSILRIRVIINIQKPLERGRSLTIAGKAHWVSFKYENLPVFCFYCGRIAHEEGGCPNRTQTEQIKEWGVWLRADKSNKQGMGRGFERQLTGTNQRHTGVPPMGGGRKLGKEIHGFGGNPTAQNRSHKESINGTGLPKLVREESLADIPEIHARNGEEKVLGSQSRKEELSVTGGELKLGVIGGEKQLGVTGGQVAMQEELGGKDEISEPKGQLEMYQTGRDMGPKAWAQAEGSGPKTESENKSPQEELAAPAARPTAHKKKENEPEIRMAEQGGVQLHQVCFHNSNLMWKKVPRLGEGKNHSVDSSPVIMGKRKAEVGGSNIDEQRLQKIRKWEDYLEEETETDYEDFEIETEKGIDTAEVAMQPRPQP